MSKTDHLDDSFIVFKYIAIAFMTTWKPVKKTEKHEN